MSASKPLGPPSPWELAAEAIVIKIRWFGILVGYILVNFGAVGATERPVLNAILALGAGYALMDTGFGLRGRVFLGRYPLTVSLMEALFIGLLCHFSGGVESLFRYYYFLSLICCAVRYRSRVTYLTCILHCTSYTVLYFSLSQPQRNLPVYATTVVVLAWVTWAGDALAQLLKSVGDHLARLNAALENSKQELECRIAERTGQLQETQAQLLHQEKMAAFGLLAAGIAHEVGNPLTSISSLVQMLQRRGCDPYTCEKLALVNGQLQRIQSTLRELVNFSRPASTERVWFRPVDMLSEAWSIAKYYKRTKGRVVELHVPSELPLLYGIRDELVQVFLNLILNAIDATGKAGRIAIEGRATDGFVEITVRDDGTGIGPAQAPRLFQPYFTTKLHGTGLGLFVSRKLVASHGGTIAFESLLGRGTTFLVRLPLPSRELATAPIVAVRKEADVGNAERQPTCPPA